MTDLAKAIRRAAETQGIGVEALRRKARLSNGRFYRLLGGQRPKKLDAIEKLRRAGVEVDEAL